MRHIVFIILLLYTGCSSLHARNRCYNILDAKRKEPVAFAVIKFCNSGQGMIATLEGGCCFPEESETGTCIEISAIGYETKTVPLPADDQIIYLKPSANELLEVVIKPQTDKIRRILNATIAARQQNNPDLYDWYSCSVYYKMIVDLVPTDKNSTDTAKSAVELREFFDNQHLILAETFSRRTWERPQKLQEEILATRISGFKKSLFTSMVTDVLPFHSYTDYITLNGKDYHNPVSRGFMQFYTYNLSDEIIQGNDTIWAISFRPKGKNANELKGTVFIHSDGYAISSLKASSADNMLNREIVIEQQYQQITENGVKKWFPYHLNYIIDFHLGMKKDTINYHFTGNSLIDSVTFIRKNNFRFNKEHTVQLRDGADQLHDSTWDQLRSRNLYTLLDKKESRTYKMMDSLGAAMHFDKFANLMSGLPEGKLPVWKLDVDLARLVSSNFYENFRLGLGLQTNDKISKRFSAGGWAGYGFKDVHWKYGAFGEVYLSKDKEFRLKAGYDDDIADPGRVLLHRDLDKNYLKSYLLRRVDRNKTWYAGIKKQIGYWQIGLSGKKTEIQPLYTYALITSQGAINQYTTTEANLDVRYSFGERRAPFFGHYLPTGSNYPVVYGRLSKGLMVAGSTDINYTQAVAAITWHKHINRMGFEHILVEGGKTWSSSQLPLSKLFASNGFRNDQQSLYTFGAMMTLSPYDCYTDQFINLLYRHDFDFKLYSYRPHGSSLSSAPFISLQYNMLWGTMQYAEKHTGATFFVPDNAYHEAGVIVNSLVRLNYLNVYYFTLNIGYFSHIARATNLKQDGRIVYGLGVEF